jgi:hypothetical protein
MLFQVLGISIKACRLILGRSLRLLVFISAILKAIILAYDFIFHYLKLISFVFFHHPKSRFEVKKTSANGVDKPS